MTLTSAAAGVAFDIDGDGTAEHVSWTADESSGWLVLDRNGDHQITSGKEMFGNFTDQPPSFSRNGFTALSVFDLARSGGDGNGVIDQNDAVFSQLQIWVDSNHNGISEPSELSALLPVGITSIDLNYRKSERTDQFGNQFMYRAKVERVPDCKIGEYAYDVFLLQ